MAYLTIQNDRSTEVRALTGPLSLGRSPDCALYFPDRLLSRRHLRLEQTARGWLVVDLQSTNGTLVSGQKITSHLLRDGDAIEAGSLTLRFSSAVPALQDGGDENSNGPSADQGSQISLEEREIAEILNQRESDSVDEEPSEFQLVFASDPVEASLPMAPASARIASPAQGSPLKVDTPSLWEIAMKPPGKYRAAAGSSSDSAASLPVAAESQSWKSTILRLPLHPQLKRAAAIAAITLLALGGYTYFGTSGTSGSHAQATAASAGGPAPAHTRNGAFDLPV